MLESNHADVICVKITLLISHILHPVFSASGVLQQSFGLFSFLYIWYHSCGIDV